MLPRVKIYFENGLLGATDASDDGVVGLIATGIATYGESYPDGVKMGEPFLITQLKELEEKGVTETPAGESTNGLLYKTVKEFYEEAPNGTKLWIVVEANDTSLTGLLSTDGEKLITAAGGALNVLMVNTQRSSDYSPTRLDGADSDVWNAMDAAQQIAEAATDDLYAPLTVVLPVTYYTGQASALRNLTTFANNRVAIVVGDTESGSETACVGLVAGRIASIPVQRSIARVKSGAISEDNLYLGTVAAENGQPAVINDKGYICPRTFTGKAGYYWADDKLATAATDDYALIPRRRVIDKAYRIAYKTLVDELNEEIPVTDNGQIPASTVKALQNTVESAIENNMTVNGNLGNDPSDDTDTGVECYIDPAQNVVSTNQLKVSLRVKPYGYAKYIDVSLGFKTTTS